MQARVSASPDCVNELPAHPGPRAASTVPTQGVPPAAAMHDSPARSRCLGVVVVVMGGRRFVEFVLGLWVSASRRLQLAAAASRRAQRCCGGAQAEAACNARRWHHRVAIDIHFVTDPQQWNSAPCGIRVETRWRMVACAGNR